MSCYTQARSQETIQLCSVYWSPCAWSNGKHFRFDFIKCQLLSSRGQNVICSIENVYHMTFFAAQLNELRSSPFYCADQKSVNTFFTTLGFSFAKNLCIQFSCIYFIAVFANLFCKKKILVSRLFFLRFDHVKVK